MNGNTQLIKPLMPQPMKKLRPRFQRMLNGPTHSSYDNIGPDNCYDVTWSDVAIRLIIYRKAHPPEKARRVPATTLNIDLVYGGTSDSPFGRIFRDGLAVAVAHEAKLRRMGARAENSVVNTHAIGTAVNNRQHGIPIDRFRPELWAKDSPFLIDLLGALVENEIEWMLNTTKSSFSLFQTKGVIEGKFVRWVGFDPLVPVWEINTMKFVCNQANFPSKPGSGTADSIKMLQVLLEASGVSKLAKTCEARPLGFSKQRGRNGVRLGQVSKHWLELKCRAAGTGALEFRCTFDDDADMTAIHNALKVFLEGHPEQAAEESPEEDVVEATAAPLDIMSQIRAAKAVIAKADGNEQVIKEWEAAKTEVTKKFLTYEQEAAGRKHQLNGEIARLKQQVDTIDNQLERERRKADHEVSEIDEQIANERAQLTSAPEYVEARALLERLRKELE